MDSEYSNSDHSGSKKRNTLNLEHSSSNNINPESIDNPSILKFGDSFSTDLFSSEASFYNFDDQINFSSFNDTALDSLRDKKSFSFKRKSSKHNSTSPSMKSQHNSSVFEPHVSSRQDASSSDSSNKKTLSYEDSSKLEFSELNNTRKKSIGAFISRLSLSKIPSSANNIDQLKTPAHSLSKFLPLQRVSVPSSAPPVTRTRNASLSTTFSGSNSLRKIPPPTDLSTTLNDDIPITKKISRSSSHKTYSSSHRSESIEKLNRLSGSNTSLENNLNNLDKIFTAEKQLVSDSDSENLTNPSNIEKYKIDSTNYKATNNYSKKSFEKNIVKTGLNAAFSPIKPVNNKKLINVLKSKAKKLSTGLNSINSPHSDSIQYNEKTDLKDNPSDLSDSISITGDLCSEDEFKENPANSLKSPESITKNNIHTDYNKTLTPKAFSNYKHDSIESTTDVDMNHKDFSSDFDSVSRTLDNKYQPNIILEKKNSFSNNDTSTISSNIETDNSSQKANFLDKEAKSVIYIKNTKSRTPLISINLKKSDMSLKSSKTDLNLKSRSSYDINTITLFKKPSIILPESSTKNINNLTIDSNYNNISSEAKNSSFSYYPSSEPKYITDVSKTSSCTSLHRHSLDEPKDTATLLDSSSTNNSKNISSTTEPFLFNNKTQEFDNINYKNDNNNIKKLDPLALSFAGSVFESDYANNYRRKQKISVKITNSLLSSKSAYNDKKRMNYIPKLRVKVLFLCVDNYIKNASLLKSPTIQVLKYMFYSNFPELNLQEEGIHGSDSPRLMIWNNDIKFFIDYFENMEIDEFSVIKWVSNLHPLPNIQLNKQYKSASNQLETLELLKAEIQGMKTQLNDLPKEVVKTLETTKLSKDLMAELELKNSTLTNDLEQSNKSNKALKIQITSLKKKQQAGQEYFESTNESLQNEINKLKQDLEQSNNLIKELEDIKSKSLVDSDFIKDRENIINGKNLIKTEYNSLGQKMENIEILINELRKDVILRGSTPQSNLLDLAKSEIADIVNRGKVLNDFMNNAASQWKKIWEKELQSIVSEQNLVKHVVSELGELLKDADILGELLTKIVSAISYKMSNKSKQPIGANLSAVLGNTSQEEIPDLRNHIHDEINALHVDHTARLDAIDQLERVRQFNSLLPKNDFESELSSFIQSDALKKIGGVEELEKTRKEKEQKVMIEMLRQFSHIMKKNLSTAQGTKRPNIGLGLGLGLNSNSITKKPKIFSKDFEEEKSKASINEKNEIKIDVNEDPFEEYMRQIDEQAIIDCNNMGKSAEKEASNIYEELDAEEQSEQNLTENNQQKLFEISTNFVRQQYADSDEEVYETAKNVEIGLSDDKNLEDIYSISKKHINPLSEIDHTQILYKDVKKNFYSPCKEIEDLEESVLENLKKKFGIRVYGDEKIRPCISFAHFGLPDKMIDVIARLKFTEPTPIQKQAVPLALSGNDIIGIAKTGSGKTGAFLWPMIIHILGQTVKSNSEGPGGIILAPTRELVSQIYNESRKYTKVMNLEIVALFGGVSKHEQLREILKKAPEIIVSTPGRLIDIIEDKGIDLKNVSFLVLDEADRMLNLGFEKQVKSICSNIRPDRQTLLFSATFPKNIENLAKSTTVNPVKVIIGNSGQINDDITEEFHIFDNDDKKWDWLISNMVKFTMIGNILIFTTHKISSEILANQLQQAGFKCKCLHLHGDMLQNQRDTTLYQFKNNKVKIMVATDVASRGLDIKNIKTVINYDSSKDIDSYVHRVGRTGRAGEKGTAITLLVNGSLDDINFASKYFKKFGKFNQELNISPVLAQFAQINGIKQNIRNREKFYKNPLENPGLSYMVQGSRLPGDRSGLGQK
ncbi:hypothetical protein BB561_005494 [Smittium simulii]|uniref:RNA helicase n=1 Tax=Smittium simulii TaxID=133385 RepID=A0A2T9YA77_9FUNG|nr:hypothetical protein BB561_005494 [Smittium simulii]